MAVKIGIEAKRDDVLRVDPFDVIVKEEGRGRWKPPQGTPGSEVWDHMTAERVIKRAISFYHDGQLTPVECRLNAERMPILVFGYTRTAAARLLRTGFKAIGPNGEPEFFYQKEDFPLQVKIVNCNEADAVKRNIVENAQRDDTTDIDDAHNHERLRRDYGYSDTDIAKLYGYELDNGRFNTNRVGRLKKLLQLPNEIQLWVHEGKLSTSKAVELLELPEDQRIPTAKAAMNGDGGAVVKAIRQTQLAAGVLTDDHGDTDEGDGEASSNGHAGTNGKSGKGKKGEPRFKPHTPKEIRTAFEALRDAEEVDPALKRFAQDFLKYQSGRMTDKGLYTALDRLLDAKRGKVLASAK
jgi:ParB-like chromosome segregation protein Spo0J